MKIDLVISKVNVTNPGTDSNEEKADITYLVSLPQWRSMRNWFVRQACDFYNASGTAAKDEAYILSRLGKFIVDTVNEMETMSTLKEQGIDQHDAYEDEKIEQSVIPGANNHLPLGEI